MSTQGWSRGTRESVAAAARCFGSREELADALEMKGWAVFLSTDGTRWPERRRGVLSPVAARAARA